MKRKTIAELEKQIRQLEAQLTQQENSHRHDSVSWEDAMYQLREKWRTIDEQKRELKKVNEDLIKKLTETQSLLIKTEGKLEVYESLTDKHIGGKAR